MKQKFISLALAVMLLLGVTGCAMSTPASVVSDRTSEVFSFFYIFDCSF